MAFLFEKVDVYQKTVDFADQLPRAHRIGHGQLICPRLELTNPARYRDLARESRHVATEFVNGLTLDPLERFLETAGSQLENNRPESAGT